MRRALVCPTCGVTLEAERRMMGFVKRYPSACPACSVGLLYDTAGGVYAAEPDESGPEKPGAAASPERDSSDVVGGSSRG